MSDVEVVAAFDFDGTLSSRDNFVPFLRRFGGTAGFVEASVAGAAAMLASGRREWSRNHLKAEVLQRIMGGRAVVDLENAAHAFAGEIVAHHLRAEAVERAAWHRAHGHRLVIVSASLGAYLRPVAAHLAFDAVLATELEVGDDGRLTGRMLGENVRGPEKVRRLDEYLACHFAGRAPFVWAYGDSSGDRELWARADRAVRLGRRALRGTA